MRLSFDAVAVEFRRRALADFARLPVKVRAARVAAWVRARLRGLGRRRPAWPVRSVRPVLRPARPMRVAAGLVELPRPGPAISPAQPCGP